MNYYLFLFAAIGTLILFAVEWHKNGARPKNWIKFVLAFAVGCIVAYTINNNFTQSIAVMGAVLMSKWFVDGFLRLSGAPQIQGIKGFDKDGRPYWTVGRKWFAACVVSAFVAFGSMAQINSAWADANNFNTGWKIIMVAFGLIAIFCIWMVSKNSNKGGGN